jgi:hypothetical protein
MATIMATIEGVKLPKPLVLSHKERIKHLEHELLLARNEVTKTHNESMNARFLQSLVNDELMERRQGKIGAQEGS